MKKLASVLVGVAFCAAFGWRAGVRADSGSDRGQTGVKPGSDGGQTPVAAPQALNDSIKRFCGNCHNNDAKKGELSFDHFDIAQAATHPEIGEKMIRKLRTGLM